MNGGLRDAADATVEAICGLGQSPKVSQVLSKYHDFMTILWMGERSSFGNPCIFKAISLMKLALNELLIASMYDLPIHGQETL
jgi:hypothetical protein